MARERSVVSRRTVVVTAGRLVAGGLGSAALAACGATTGTPGGEQGGPPSGRVVELRVHGQATSDIEGYNKIVDAFNEKYAG